MKKRIDLMMRTKLLLILGVCFFSALTVPAYAFGPYVHHSAMKEAHDTLVGQYPEVPVIWTVGNAWGQLEADLNGPSHGANVDLNAGLLNSNLPEFIESEFMEIKTGFMHYLDGDRSVDLSKPIRRLSHYISDGMAIGQISGPSLWGWKDDLTDLACEGVSNKRAWPSYVRDWGAGQLEDGLEDFREAVLATYTTYRKDADKWFKRFPWFPTSRDVTHMTRRGVAQGATLTSSFILLAWQDAIEAYEALTNPGFEDKLDFWKAYGDGFVQATGEDAFNGSYSAHIQRDAATGKYFGLYQQGIVVEPDTEYRLSLWVKTQATSGHVAAGLGVWSSDPAVNHHSDFGRVGGTSDWTHITGTWKSSGNEQVIRIMLFGSPDFVGKAYFDDLALEEVEPQEEKFGKDTL